MIGNGAQDPSSLSDHGDLFYHLSFFDEEERDYFREQTGVVASLVAQERWLEALEVSVRVTLLTLMVCVPLERKSCVPVSK